MLSDNHDLADPAALTPLRAHYLKKSLIQLQFKREVDDISSNNVSALSYLGSPFTPPPKDAPSLDLPFLRYIFKQYVLTFPFMAAAPKDFYSDKLQPFLSAALTRNLSSASVLDDNEERSEQETRLKIVVRFEKNISLFLGAATKLVEQEEVVRLSTKDLDRLEALAKKRQAKLARTRETFEVNIVGVRTVVDKGRMRSRIHEEFIIRTRRSNYPDVFVSRRYGDFRTLSDELHKAHPEEVIRMPPVKDRRTASAPMTPSGSTSMSRQSTQSDSPLLDGTSPCPPSRLIREKNRLTLRAYLHSLITSPTIASSPVLRSFLTSGPTTLSPEELEDAKKREEADQLREEGRKRFAREIASRVESLREAVKSMKGDIMGKDGLTHVFATVKTTPNVRDLPSNYRAVLEWARISIAATVFQHFVAADDSSETFANLKRIHGLMPYFMLKAALKISNPISMIRSVLDLFLAQPFGGRSLLQRMFTSSLSEEVKVLEEDIDAVKAKIDDPVMCEKIRQFVHGPREIQDMLKADAARENMSIFAIIMRNGDQSALSRPQAHRLARARRAHALYVKYRETLLDSDDDDGPQDEDAWLFEDFKVLAQLYSRLRDREELIALIFEGFTAELLKDIITIFYSPLAQVYKAANIAESLSDLQNFINDLIKTVEQLEELRQEDPHLTVQIFIDLIQRHEQSFYTFVHRVHSKGEGLFDSLMRWIERFLTVIREGLGNPVSLECLLPHMGQERMDIIREVDAVALYHYKLKIAYEDKIRRRFGRLQGQTDADAEDEATQAMLQGLAGEFDLGELVRGDAIDVAAEASGESEYESSSGYDSDTDAEDSDSSSEDAVDEVPKPTSPRPPSATSPPPPPPPLTMDSPPLVKSPLSPPSDPSSSSTANSKPRQRSLSLRLSQSLNSLRYHARHSHDSPAPPVPPLPKSLHSAATDRIPRPSALSPPSRTLLQTPKMKSKKTPEVKPPELIHLPKLLPIFVEMMRPLLRSHQPQQ